MENWHWKSPPWRKEELALISFFGLNPCVVRVFVFVGVWPYRWHAAVLRPRWLNKTKHSRIYLLYNSTVEYWMKVFSAWIYTALFLISWVLRYFNCLCRANSSRVSCFFFNFLLCPLTTSLGPPWLLPNILFPPVTFHRITLILSIDSMTLVKAHTTQDHKGLANKIETSLTNLFIFSA